MKTYTTLFLFTLVFLVSFADTTEINATQGEIETIKSLSNDRNELSESEAYKLLYENQLKSNDSVLKTIYYALGGIGTAMIFVFASNWWFNEKKVKDLSKGINSQIEEGKDKAIEIVTQKINELSLNNTKEINQQIVKLNKEINNSTQNLTKQINDSQEKLRLELKSDNKSLTENYQKQIDSINETRGEQITSLKKDIEIAVATINEALRLKEELLKELISSEVQARNYEVDSIKESIHRTEYWLWEGRGIPNNAIRAQLSELELRIKSKSELKWYLEQILETSKELKWFSSYEKKDVRRVLEKVPNIYHDIVESILAITDNVKEDLN